VVSAAIVLLEVAAEVGLRAGATGSATAVAPGGMRARRARTVMLTVPE
jgi:hypothetical protein